MRATSESAEWIFLATNLGLEMLSAACDQASSPRRPQYAQFGMLLAIAAVLISISELIYRGKKEGVVLRRWGMLWWFYHPPPLRHTPFGTLPDIYGLVAAISQCICSIVQYVYCLRHADSPFKASLLPAIFLICLGASKLSNNRMNANTTDNKDSLEKSSSMEEIPLCPIPNYHAPTNILDNQAVKVEGNIEQKHKREREREQKWKLEQEQEQEREWWERVWWEWERDRDREREQWERVWWEWERDWEQRDREQEQKWKLQQEQEQKWKLQREHREWEQEQERQLMQLMKPQWQEQKQKQKQQWLWRVVKED